MNAAGDLWAFGAFTELIDNVRLIDAAAIGYAGAAIAVSIDRDTFGTISVGVHLKEITGEQLAHVVEIARRHELSVREEAGWLRLGVTS